jgi:hypothetical protein
MAGECDAMTMMTEGHRDEKSHSLDQALSRHQPLGIHVYSM